jgi:predicted nucleic acid-binding protein
VNVIDASSLAKYVLKEAGWREVRRALEEETVSVDHVLKEVANAVWRKAVILKLEPVEAAWKRLHVLLKLVEEGVIVVEDEQKYLSEAFKIAVENKIAVYDALYLAQAIKLKAALVTSDEKQANVARELGIKVHYIP